MLTGKNIIVYDLEIKKPIEQCKRGWKGYDEMGVSVGCAYDYRDNKFRVFMDDNLQELVDRLNEPMTVIVAFNHINFDNRLLRGIGLNLKPDVDLLNYDMMRVSKFAACGNPDGMFKGFRLDDHLQALGLPMKTANGAMAPIWFQEGKVGKLVDYCLNDVTQEKALFEYFFEHGVAACAYKSTKYSVPKYDGMFAGLI